MTYRARTAIELVARIVSRRTKGAAFNPPLEGYEALMARVRAEVQRDAVTLTSQEFRTKYALWLDSRDR